jgi:PEP-CTERM motif
MKALILLVAVVSCLLIIASPGIAFAGATGGPNQLPEPTTLLVWLGLASAGGFFFWRRNRGEQ